MALMNLFLALAAAAGAGIIAYWVGSMVAVAILGGASTFLPISFVAGLGVGQFLGVFIGFVAAVKSYQGVRS